MPNTRRRRFSVQNEIANRQQSKIQNGQSSHGNPEELKVTVNSLVTPKPSKSKSKFNANTSKNQCVLKIVTECESVTSLAVVKNQSEIIPVLYIEQDDTAVVPKKNYAETVSSNIDDSDKLKELVTPLNSPSDPQKTGDSKQISRERTPRQEKYPRQHRIKVRSPKPRTPILDQLKTTDVNTTIITKKSIGTNSINWEEELEVCKNVTSLIDNTDDDERPSTHSLDDMCRICHGGESLSMELGRLISACLCRGTVGRVHVKCLERWLTESGKSRCELCGTRYSTRRVHRYGIPRALVMWILSQNAKQLMVDSLGIMLMSPLAVLAAWLTGRTLAGLMTQESHVTPWPLASTFVLACMTLVCYYCWIVSAATRHALGWWIWYRSQYEVRLEIQDNEE